MSGKVLKTLTLLLALAVPTTYAGGLATIAIESYRHEYNTDYFRVLTVQLVNFTDHMALNGSVVLAQEMNDIEIAYLVSVPRREGKPWNLFNLTTDACKLLEMAYRKTLNIPYIVVSIMKLSSRNFPEKCPMQKNVEMSFIDIYVNTEKYPISFPDVKVNVVFTMSNKNVLAYRCFMTVAITSKDKKKRLG